MRLEEARNEYEDGQRLKKKSPVQQVDERQALPKSRSRRAQHRAGAQPPARHANGI